MAPSLWASDSPMAIACLGFVTIFFDRPERKVPCLNSCITSATFLAAADTDFLADLLFCMLASILASRVFFRNSDVSDGATVIPTGTTKRRARRIGMGGPQ